MQNPVIHRVGGALAMAALFAGLSTLFSPAHAAWMTGCVAAASAVALFQSRLAVPVRVRSRPRHRADSSGLADG